MPIGPPRPPISNTPRSSMPVTTSSNIYRFFPGNCQSSPGKSCRRHYLLARVRRRYHGADPSPIVS
jgi:hypothetical protein